MNFVLVSGVLTRLFSFSFIIVYIRKVLTPNLATSQRSLLEADLNINLVRATLLACEAYRILGPSENAFIYFFQIRFSDSVMQIKKTSRGSHF